MTTKDHNGFPYSDDPSTPEEPERPIRHLAAYRSEQEQILPDPRNKIIRDLEAALRSSQEIIQALQMENRIFQGTIGRLHVTFQELKDRLHREQVHERMIRQNDAGYEHDAEVHGANARVRR